MFMDSIGISFADVALATLTALKAKQTWDYRKNTQRPAAQSAPPPSIQTPINDVEVPSEPQRLCYIYRPDGTFHSTRPSGHPDITQFIVEGFAVKYGSE